MRHCVARGTSWHCKHCVMDRDGRGTMALPWHPSVGMWRHQNCRKHHEIGFRVKCVQPYSHKFFGAKLWTYLCSKQVHVLYCVDLCRIVCTFSLHWKIFLKVHSTSEFEHLWIVDHAKKERSLLSLPRATGSAQVSPDFSEYQEQPLGISAMRSWKELNLARAQKDSNRLRKGFD